MEESVYTKTVYENYNKNFPQGWIENLDWSAWSNKRNTQVLQKGVNQIETFINVLFTNYSKLVLSGDQFAHKTECIGKISESLLLDVYDDDNGVKGNLYSLFSDMQEDVRKAENLIKYHCNITREQFQSAKPATSIEAVTLISNHSHKNDLIDLLELICDVCWAEYKFSYGENYIKHILYLRGRLKCFQRKYSVFAGDIINTSIEKLEILLAKLSAYSENRQITSKIDFNLETFKIGDIEKYSVDDFRRLFQEYLEPNLIDPNSVWEWQNNSNQNDVDMWKLAMLMRYYTKVTKSSQQIDNLLKINEEQHKDYMSKHDDNIVNIYADRTFRNYMYNCRFSFRCQCDNRYSYDDMRKDLDKIESIQNDTLFYSYHPYEHALEFAINYLEKEINEVSSDAFLKEVLTFIQSIFEKFKKNVEWCKENQPYLMQMRFNFSSLQSEGRNFKVFCPSSFCRPIRFSLLDEMQIKFNNHISFLSYQVEHINDRKSLQTAMNKIGQIEEKNIKYMGLYAGVMTFLVGLLSIFVGNTGTVTLENRMQFVVALGLILLVFTSAGYFAMSEKYDKLKPWIFGTILVLALIGIIIMINHF